MPFLLRSALLVQLTVSPAACTSTANFSGSSSSITSVGGAVASSSTAAGYHLGPTCTLADQAVAAGLVTTDYDGEPRSTGANGYPEIGPDECY